MEENMVKKKVVKKIILEEPLESFIVKEWGKKDKLEESKEICIIKYKELLKQQQELAEQHKDYILGIDSFNYNTQQQELHITYNCSENAQSFNNINFQSTEEKFNVFVQLVSLSQYLIDNKILHNNIKSTNIIIDNNKLYLTDFGYDQSDRENPTLFKDCLNFINPPSVDQINQHYAYLQIDQLQNQNENIQKKSDETVKMQDQYALTVMMIQIFYTFPKVCSIQDIIDLQYLQRIKEIKNLKENNKQVPEYALFIIVEILKDRIQNQYFNQYTKIAPILNYKVNKQDLINQENSQKAQKIFKAKEYDSIDKMLLYYFSNEELKNLFNNIMNNIEYKKLKKKIYKKMILSKNENINKLNEMSIEDKFIFLVYLDEKINRDDIDQKEQLKQFEQKLKLKYLYDEINKKSKKDFKFNNYNLDNDSSMQFKQSLVNPNQFQDYNLEKKYDSIQDIDQIQKILSQSGIQSNIDPQVYPITDILLQSQQEEENALKGVKNEILREYFRQIINQEEFSSEKKFSRISQNDFEEDEEGKNINIKQQQNSKEIISIIQLENRKSNKKRENLIIYYSECGDDLIYKEYQVLEFKTKSLDNSEHKQKLLESKCKFPDNYEYMYDFNLNKEFKAVKDFQTKKVSVNLKDVKQNIKYIGGCEIQGQEQDIIKNIQFDGMGVRELLNKNTLRKGQIYKVEGKFENNKPSGEMKTYFYRTQTHCIGLYKNGKLSGYQEHFIEGSDEPIKKTYHLNICCCYAIEFKIV